VEDKTVVSGLRWYAYTSDQYGLLITVDYVGGDFSQTGQCYVYISLMIFDYTRVHGCYSIVFFM